MIGLIFTVLLVGLVVITLCTMLRNVLVEGLTALGQFVGSILDAGIMVVMRAMDLLTRLIADSYDSLRDIHGDKDARYGRFWDVVIPILFILLLGVLAYADYQLFAARIGPLLGLEQLPQASDVLLNLVLGALYVVTLFVIGYALSDSYGHSPAGRSLIFGKFGDAVKKVLWASVVVLAVTTAALAIWTVEVTILNTSDQFTAGLFFVTFSFLAVFATALCVGPALIGILALMTLMMEIARIALWLIGAILWLLLTVVDRFIEVMVKVGINIPAKLGESLYGRFMTRREPQEWPERTPISRFVSDFPLVTQAVPIPPQTMPALPDKPEAEPESGRPVGRRQLDRGEATGSRSRAEPPASASTSTREWEVNNVNGSHPAGEGEM